ncbi:MAG: hypothetical protein AAF363_09245 [Bacteroidota bacterium]
MKKIILLIFSTFSLSAFAQEQDATISSSSETEESNSQETTSDFRPSAGDISLELQFEPFGDNPIDINGIRARFFSSQRKAFRLNVFLGVDVDTDITQQANPDVDLLELKDRTSVVTVNIRPGYEWHTKGTERLSPYFGFEVDFAIQTSRFRTEDQTGNNEINYTKFINDNGFYRLGLNAVAGLDYYFSKKIYLGAEFGFGASVTRLLDQRVDSDFPGFEEPDPINRGGSFDLGPNVNVDIRLGYVF